MSRDASKDLDFDNNPSRMERVKMHRTSFVGFYEFRHGVNESEMREGLREVSVVATGDGSNFLGVQAQQAGV